MYKTDIERLVAQARQIERLGMEVLEDAETLAANDTDTSTATDLGEKQTELQNEMEQALLDIETALERSDGVGHTPNYTPSLDSFTVEWDESAEEATIAYNGDKDLSNQYITVYVAGEEVNNLFSDPTSTGEQEVIDTSSLNDMDEVVVEWIATDDGSGKYTLPNSNRAPVSKSNLPPQSKLVGDTHTYSASIEISR